QQARAATATLPRVTPADLACLVINRLEHRLRPTATVRSAPSLRIVTQVIDVVNAERARGIHVEQSRLRAEGGRRPVRGTPLIRRDERAVYLRHFARVWNRLSFGIVTKRPVGLHELRRGQSRAIGPIENEEMSISSGLGNQFARLSVDLPVEDHRGLC